MRRLYIMSLNWCRFLHVHVLFETNGECNKWIITQGAGTPCFFRMLITVFLSRFKTNFGLKCLQTSLTCISLCQISLDPSIFISLLRLMIGINYYVLCCLGRCEVNPLHMVGTIDRKDRCDICCFIMHRRITSSELFFSCLLRIRMCLTEIRCYIYERCY